MLDPLHDTPIASLWPAPLILVHVHGLLYRLPPVLAAFGSTEPITGAIVADFLRPFTHQARILSGTSAFHLSACITGGEDPAGYLGVLVPPYWSGSGFGCGFCLAFLEWRVTGLLS